MTLDAEGSGGVVIEELEGKQQFSMKRLLRFIGPGLLMSIAYVDPGNLESDLQTGAKTGYVLLWLMLLTTVLGFLVQLQSAKLGVATGKHLAQHCREQYSVVPRLVLWIMAEVAIIGSDIQEVIGSAIALLLLSNGYIPLWAGVLITAVDAFLLLFLERFGVRLLEALFAVMIGVMVVSFGVMFSRADVPADQVFWGFLWPVLPQKDVPTAVALVGSLIMPHNIYLHSALVLSRQSYMTTPARKKEAVTYFGIESALSLAAAVVINLFVVAVFARGFYGREDVPEIGLANAGTYLGETYGQATVFIWALGLLAAGQSSTMTGTYTGQFVMDGYLNLKISPWKRITITRACAIVPTLAIALMYDQEGERMDQLNQSLNLLQSIQLPFALIPLLLFTSTPSIMGEAFISHATSFVTGVIALMVIAINALAVYEGTLGTDKGAGSSTQMLLGVLLVVVCYLSFLIWLVVSHFRRHTAGGAAAGPALDAAPEAAAPLYRFTSGGSGGLHDELTAPLLHTFVLEASAPLPDGADGDGAAVSIARSLSGKRIPATVLPA